MCDESESVQAVWVLWRGRGIGSCGDPIRRRILLGYYYFRDSVGKKKIQMMVKNQYMFG